MINDLKNGNFVNINFQNGYKAVYKVKNISTCSQEATLKELGSNNNIIINSPEKWRMIEPILLEERFLTNWGFIKDDEYSVYGLPDNGAYVKFVKYGNDIIVRKEKKDWVIVIQDYNAYYGCRFYHIPYLHLLQNEVSKYWDFEYDEPLLML